MGRLIEVAVIGRRGTRAFLFVAALLTLALWVWFRGVLAAVLVAHLAPRLLPVAAGKEGEVTAVSFGAVSLSPTRGGVLAISPRRLRKLVAEALGGTWFVPSGLLRDGLRIEGRWFPEGVDRKYAVPITIACTELAGPQPKLVLRYPGPELNALLKEDAAHKMARERKYMLGHYDMAQQLSFRTGEITSMVTNGAPRYGPRVIDVEATGRVRYEVADGPFAARTAADVRRLRGRVLMRFVRHADGIGIDYDVQVDELKVAVNNLAPWAERKIADALQESLERSTNKPRKRERMARRRLPAWFPFDLELDIRLTDTVPAPPEGES